MTYDVTRGVTVLFGGFFGSQVFTDTWEWDGTDWTQRQPTASPPGRYAATMTFDLARNRTVLTGGWNLTSGNVQTYSDVWEWDGTDWTQRMPNGAAPARAYAASTYHLPTSRTVVFSGEPDVTRLLADTWEYFGTPASYATFGSGCAGSAGTPALTGLASGPWIGETFTLQVGQLPVGRPAALLFGTSNTVWNGTPLPFDLTPIGMPGCQLLVSADVTLPLTNNAGSATWSIALPSNPWLVGRQFVNQAFVSDPTANPLGFTTSNAGAAVIGAR